MNKNSELKNLFTQSFEQSWDRIDVTSAMPSDELEERIRSIAFSNEHREDNKKIIRFNKDFGRRFLVACIVLTSAIMISMITALGTGSATLGWKFELTPFSPRIVVAPVLDTDIIDTEVEYGDINDIEDSLHNGGIGINPDMSDKQPQTGSSDQETDSAMSSSEGDIYENDDCDTQVDFDMVVESDLECAPPDGGSAESYYETIQNTFVPKALDSYNRTYFYSNEYVVMMDFDLGSDTISFAQRVISVSEYDFSDNTINYTKVVKDGIEYLCCEGRSNVVLWTCYGYSFSLSSESLSCDELIEYSQSLVHSEG